jgi:hypothetical protein
LKAKGVALVAGITLERDRVVNERKSELGFIKRALRGKRWVNETA